MPPEPLPRKPYSMFSQFEHVKITRMGRKVTVRANDGTFQESDSVESNLLYDILNELRKKK